MVTHRSFLAKIGLILASFFSPYLDFKSSIYYNLLETFRWVVNKLFRQVTAFLRSDPSGWDGLRVKGKFGSWGPTIKTRFQSQSMKLIKALVPGISKLTTHSWDWDFLHVFRLKSERVPALLFVSRAVWGNRQLVRSWALVRPEHFWGYHRHALQL